MNDISTEMMILYLALLAIPILPNLWSIWHVYQHDFATSTTKMFWILITVFLPVIGGIMYILFGRKKARDLI